MNNCDVCGNQAEQKDAIYCNACFYSGKHMEKALREGITLEYSDGTIETIKEQESER